MQIKYVSDSLEPSLGPSDVRRGPLRTFWNRLPGVLSLLHHSNYPNDVNKAPAISHLPTPRVL